MDRDEVPHYPENDDDGMVWYEHRIRTQMSQSCNVEVNLGLVVERFDTGLDVGRP